MEIYTLPKTRHPQINVLIEKFEKERSSEFKRLHRMIDLIEVMIKTYSSAIIGSYFDVKVKVASDNIKGLLISSIFRPSLGHWQKFSRAIMEEFLLMPELSNEQFEEIQQKLQSNQIPVLHEIYKFNQGHSKYCLQYENTYNEYYELTKNARKIYKVLLQNQFEFFYEVIGPSFYTQFDLFDKEIEQKNIINLRNKIAHGAVPPEKKCAAYVHEYVDVLSKILLRDFFQNTSIVVFTKEKNKIIPIQDLENENSCLPLDYQPDKDIQGGHPYLLNEYGKLIDLFPIMYYGPETEIPKLEHSLLFLNDLNEFEQKRIVSKLHYPSAEHVKDQLVYQDFIRVLNISKWKEEGRRFLSKFSGLVEELTTDFVGRTDELGKMEGYINDHSKGFFIITGAPGIGKSAIVAQFASTIKQRKNIHVVDYYIKRGHGYDNPTSFFNHYLTSLSKHFNIDTQSGSSFEEKFEAMQKLLYEISLKLTSKKEKLVIVVDGLDEAPEDLLSFVPKFTYENIFFFFSTRMNKETEQFLGNIQNLKKPLVLEGLTKDNIRALVWSVVSKYKVDNDKYINAIYEKSKGKDAKGNALYVRLLCKALVSGEIEINQIGKLPEGIKGFYDNILIRLIGQSNSLNALYAFAVTKDFITIKQFATILQLEHDEQVLQIIMNLQELLLETPNGFQLFHESLREYLLDASDEKSKYIIPEKVTEVRNLVLHYCQKWEQYVDKNGNPLMGSLFEYPFKYYAQHLFEMNQSEELFCLLENESFLQKQITGTKGYEHSFSMYNLGLQLADSNKLQLKIAVKLLNLHQQLFRDSKEIFANLEMSLDHVADFLGKIINKDSTEQIIFYILLLYKALDHETEQKKEILDFIIQHFEENMTKDLSVLNINKFTPSPLFLNLLIRLKENNISIVPLLERNYPEEDVHLLLESFDWKNTEEVSVCLMIVEQFPELHNKAMYAMELADRLAEMGETKLTEEVLKKVEAFTENLSLDYQIRLFSEIARDYYNVHNLQESDRIVKKLLSTISKESLELHLSKYAFEERHLPFLQYLCSQLPISTPFYSFYFNYCNLLVKKERYLDAFPLLMELNYNNITSYKIKDIIESYLNAARYDLAEKLIETILTGEEQIEYFIELAKEMNKANLEIEEIMDKVLISAKSDLSGEDLDYMYSEISRAYLDMDHEQESQKIFSLIKNDWYKDSVRARQVYHLILKKEDNKLNSLFNQIIYVSGIENAYKEAAKAYTELDEFNIAKQYLNKISKESPKEDLYGLIALKMCERGLYDESLPILKNLNDNDGFAIVRIVRTLIQKHDIHESLRFIHLVSQEGMVNNFHPAYRELEKTLIMEERIEELTLLYQETGYDKSRNFLVNHFLKEKNVSAVHSLKIEYDASIVELFIHNGLIKEGIEHAERLFQHKGRNSKDLNRIMSELSLQKQYHSVLQLLNFTVSMEDQVKTTNKEKVLQSLINHFAKRNDFSHFPVLMKLGEISFLNLSSFAKYICYLLKNGEEDEAKKCFQFVGKQNSNITSKLFDELIDDKLYKIAFEWIDKGILPFTESNLEERTLIKLCEGLCKEGYFEDAMKLSSKIEDKESAEKYYFQLARYFLANSNKIEALNIINEIEKNMNDGYSLYFPALIIARYAEISTLLHDFKDPSASIYLEKAKQKVKKLKEREEIISAQVSIAKELRKQGRQNQARNVLRKALKEMAKGVETSTDSFWVKDLTEELCTNGWYDDIHVIPQYIKGYYDESLKTIIDTLCKFNRYDLADELLGNIGEVREQIGASCSIAKQLFKKGKLSEGFEVLSRAELKIPEVEETFERHWMYHWIAYALLEQNDIEPIVGLLKRTDNGQGYIKVAETVIDHDYSFDHLLHIMKEVKQSSQKWETKKDIYETLISQIYKYYPQSEELLLQLISHVYMNKELLTRVVNDYYVYHSIKLDV
jgi:hypothetical protein